MRHPFHRLLIALFFLGVDILLIWATVTIAGSNRRTGWLWGIIAFFIPLITLIVIALVPPAGAQLRARPERTGV
jgi:hypothetical protein